MKADNTISYNLAHLILPFDLKTSEVSQQPKGNQKMLRQTADINCLTPYYSIVN